jgi:hypothetical protein
MARGSLDAISRALAIDIKNGDHAPGFREPFCNARSDPGRRARHEYGTRFLRVRRHS